MSLCLVYAQPKRPHRPQWSPAEMRGRFVAHCTVYLLCIDSMSNAVLHLFAFVLDTCWLGSDQFSPSNGSHTALVTLQGNSRSLHHHTVCIYCILLFDRTGVLASVVHHQLWRAGRHALHALFRNALHASALLKTRTASVKEDCYHAAACSLRHLADKADSSVVPRAE